MLNTLNLLSDDEEEEFIVVSQLGVIKFGGIKFTITIAENIDPEKRAVIDTCCLSHTPPRRSLIHSIRKANKSTMTDDFMFALSRAT